MSALNQHIVAIALTAAVLCALLQIFGPFLLGYRVGEKYLTISIFHILLVMWIAHRNIRDVYTIPFLQSLSPLGLKARNRIFGPTVRIEGKVGGIFCQVDIMPAKAEEFVAKIKSRL
jgi:hypothetical protein